MNAAKQLYQLQEVDLEIESDEETLNRMLGQRGESQAVIRARAELASEQQSLKEQQRQQHDLEWQIEDISGKLTAAEETLYSGRIKNPKELANLQHEVNLLKDQRTQLEDKVLEIMEQVESVAGKIAISSDKLKELEAEWQAQQQQLSANVEQLTRILSELKHQRQTLSNAIDSQAVAFYHELRKQRGTAVSKVEQGRCRGCQILLSTSELQRARSDTLVQCGSCGRILVVT